MTIYINGNSNRIPSADSVENKVFSDVIGTKLDGHGSNSLYSQSHKLDDHTHFINMLYPILAVPISLQKASGEYAAFPTPTEIVPANTITDDFDIHWAVISSISGQGDFILQLYQGPALSETLIACKSITRSAINAQEGQVFLGTPLMDANTRISGAISSGNAPQNTLGIKIEYHIY